MHQWTGKASPRGRQRPRQCPRCQRRGVIVLDGNGDVIDFGVEVIYPWGRGRVRIKWR